MSLLTVKKNQRTLRQTLEDALIDAPVSGFEHVSREHGRIVVLYGQIIETVGRIDPKLWPGCARLERMMSLRIECNRRKVLETRHYISSTALNHQQFYAAVRQHWAIENNLHWSLGVVFREYQAKI